MDQKLENLEKLADDHALKAYTRKQKIFARSGAEAELRAVALGASEVLGY